MIMVCGLLVDQVQIDGKGLGYIKYNNDNSYTTLFQCNKLDVIH